MIYIDDRIGAIELLPLFKSHRNFPLAEPKRLIAGDVCFSGLGERGPSAIGFERKRLRDALNSIRSGRLSGEQLPKLLDYYEYAYIIVEGKYRTDWGTGYLQHWAWNSTVKKFEWQDLTLGGTKPIYALELESALDSITLNTRVRLHYTKDEKATVDYIVGRERYYQKPWDKHHAHQALHVPAPYATIGKASTVRKVAFALNGLGWERSGAVAQYFRSVEAMVLATEKDWTKVPGIGKVLAGRICKELRGEYVARGGGNDDGGIEL